MNHSSPTNHDTASSPPAGKITRKQLAAHCGLCVSRIDQLTRAGVLGHYRIGKSVRYDLAEVEATLRERFHVRPSPPVSATPTDTTFYHSVASGIAAVTRQEPGLAQPQPQA